MKTQQYFPFIFGGVDVAINNKNCSILRWKSNNGFPLRFCRATEYIVLLLTIMGGKYYECLYKLPFVKRHAFRTFSAPYCRVCLVRPYHIPLRYLRNGTIFEKIVCVLSVYNIYMQHFSIYEEIKEVLFYIKRGLHVKYPLILSDVNET
jgi:hypothetical protein